MADYKHVVVSNELIVKRLSETTGLDKRLVQNVVVFVKCLVKPHLQYVDPQIFSAVLAQYFKITDQQLITRTYDKLCKQNPAGRITVEDFARIICMFLSDSLNVKIDYVFTVYDSNGDGLIDFIDLSSVIKTCKCVTDVDETDKDETFVDLFHAASDILGITAEEPIDVEAFRARAIENNLVLQTLGQCLPPTCVTEKFREMIDGKTIMDMKDMFCDIRHKLLYELPPNVRKFYPVTLDLP